MNDSGFVETNGARLYYEVEGEGHPLVLIHAGIANPRMWDDQVEALAPRYRVVRYDTRGFGQTDTDDVEFSDRADLAAVLDHVDAESTYLLGASRSGFIALDFTLEFPGRVDGLVVASGGVDGYDTGTDEQTRELYSEWGRRREARDWGWLTAFETEYWVDGPGQPPDRVDPAIRNRVEEWIGSNYRAEKEEGRPRPLEPAAATRLDEVEVPTLVMVGDLDDPTRSSRVSTWRRTCPMDGSRSSRGRHTCSTSNSRNGSTTPSSPSLPKWTQAVSSPRASRPTRQQGSVRRGVGAVEGVEEVRASSLAFDVFSRFADHDISVGMHPAERL